MKASGLDPARLDVAAFAKARASLEGNTPLASLTRLAAATWVPSDGVGGEARWRVTGSWGETAGVSPEVRLHLVVRAMVWMTCQRCLQPAALPLDIDRTFRFVPNEDDAARLDEESEEDVLALPRSLVLNDLIEDELILALPIVPRHDVCPQPLVFDGGVDTDLLASDAQPNPFAALAALKPKRSTT